MRVIISTVSLFLVLGLQSVCLGAKEGKRAMDIAESVERYVAAAQKKAQDQVEEALAEAKDEMAPTKEEMESIEWEFDDTQKQWRAYVPPTPPSVKLNRALSIITDKFGYDSAENVLVIPAGEMDAQKLAETVEDMKIMSNIFAKELAEADMLPGPRSWVFFWRRKDNDPRSIYLEGYGAVFLMEVDFPLLPVPEPDTRKVEEGTDPVWEEARRRLTASEDEILDYDSDEEVEYDADKVVGLKSKLIRNLKHASNIRNLPDEEWIVIAVTASGSETVDVRMMGGMGGGIGMTGRVGRPGGGFGVGGRIGRGSRSRRGRVSVKTGDAEIEVGGTTGVARKATTPLASGNVLIMRAKKADVDAFANGKLDFEQFQKRVQMFTY